MSPRSTITAPPEPLLPRQTVNPNDPYGLSSLYSELSVLYPDVYSSLTMYTNDAALSSYYSSVLRSYSLTDYSLPPLTATGTGAASRTNARVTSTGTRPATATSDEGGLSTGAKVGIGVGVALGLLFLVGLGVFLWCMGKRKGKKSSTTMLGPNQLNPALQHQPQKEYTQHQGYMPGHLQQQQLQHFAHDSTQNVPQHQTLQQPGVDKSYGGYGKMPEGNVVELEQEYHFAKPGVVEMGDGAIEPFTHSKK